MSTHQDDPRVDELRQRLRSLGYLDAGVDRFVLGPARGARRPAAIALLSSLRVGALAAAMLGPAAATGIRARLPDLVTGPRDAMVVALYLAIFFGVAAAAAAFIAGLLAPAVARRLAGTSGDRSRIVSRASGVIVTLACLGYLTLWWRAVVADVGWAAPLWTVSALAVAVTISLVLGHAVSIMSSAVIVAAAGGDESAPRASWRSSIMAAGVAFGAAALLLTVSTRSVPAVDSPPLTVVSSGLRLRVIAIDGVDARLLDELTAAGRVPALAQAMRGAALRFVEVDGRDPGGSDPARAWTTLATGQPASVHGVHALETRRLAGVQGSLHADPSSFARRLRGATDLMRLTRPAVASGDERRAKTFWEVAADAGLRTAVVNWWATWPARTDAGRILSDRATLRLEQGGPLDAELAPASLYVSLQSHWPEISGAAAARAAAALGEAPAADDTRVLLERSARLDALQLTLLDRIAEPGTDLSVVYLPGLDIAQHALLGASVGSASTMAERLAAIQQYYVTLDRLLASELAPREQEMVVVITEPGRVAGRPGGQMSVLGNVTTAGVRDGAATSAAPTILFALGVPISRTLASRPALELFAPAFVSRYPLRAVDTYGPPSRATAPRGTRPLDQEMIDRLRSLGYVR